MPTIITRGAGSAQGLGYASSSAEAAFIEDVFSTYLYASTSGTDNQVINGIDLSGEGGLVWSKSRTRASTNHYLIDTVRGSSVGNTKAISSNTSAAQSSGANLDYLVFNNNGYTAKAVVGGGELGTNTYYGDLVSWTFRKQPKFFDIVTYTGDGVAGRTVAHNLGSAPGCMFVKRTDAVGSWHVFHTSLGGTKALFLNATNAALTNIRYWNDTAPTSTVFTLGFDTDVNASGGTYVAYLFAHDAGGFGLTGTDNVISCGSYTTVSNAATIDLGYEPQLILHKRSDGVGNWEINDNMRGLTVAGSVEARLFPNNSDAESQTNLFGVTSTGFTSEQASATYIYIAIRRGPMKVPTSGTSVFEPIAYTGTGANNRQIGASTFVVDYILGTKRNTVDGKYFYTRLQGNGAYLSSTNTNAEAGAGSTLYGPQYGKIQLGYQQGSNDSLNLDNSGDTFINYLFRRAPGFFDEVCYTGTGVANLQTHNLGVTPELLIIRSRSQSGTYGGYWLVLSASGSNYRSLFLNTTDSNQGNFAISSISTSTTVNIGYIGSNILTAANTSAATFVAYLFATVAGVSKVGSYTGTGTTQTINCGFTSGARFVLIKRTDSTGDWYVWDSARGIVAGNDPHISLNTTAAEVTTDDSVDTDSTGFVVNQVAATNINVASASYIFLAVS